MAALLLLATTISIFSLVYSKPYTVTEEVWFDVEIKDFDGPGEDYRGRMTIALFGLTCPMTAMNFASIAKGFRGRDSFLTYRNTKIHRVVPDFVIQGGDTTVGDGTGGKSIYGDKFIDEGFKLSHKSTGIVSMANHGRDTNGSQFIITLSRARWLDNKHVVFGKVVRGMDVLKTIGEVSTNRETQTPKKPVTIIDSGVVGLDKKYDLTEEQVESNDDVM